MIELNAGDFTRSAGPVPGKSVYHQRRGLRGRGRKPNSESGRRLRRLTWGDSGGFLPIGAVLMLGTSSSDSMVDFQNPIELTWGPQTVWVAAGSSTAPVNAELSGVLSGSGGLTVEGDGTLLLSGTANTYSGGTVVESGRLIVATSGALPDGSNLTVGRRDFDL